MGTLHRPDKNLLIRYFSGQSTAEETIVAELYLALDVDHEFVKQCLKEVQAETEKEQAPVLPQAKLDDAWGVFLSRHNETGKYIPRRPYWKYAIAAAVVVFCISLLTIWFEKHAAVNTAATYAAVTTYETIEAPKGRLKKVTLPDGSTVTLFPGTRIRYPDTYNIKDRSLVVMGKAYFDVKRAENKPFYVGSGALTTRVLGTAFEINTSAGKDQQTVTLNTGKVSVEYGLNELGLLAPDEQMTISATGDFMIRKINAAQHAAWTREQLIYELIPLADICADLEAWYDIKITISQPALKNKKLTASFTKQPLNTVLDVLSRTGAFKYKTVNKSVVIY